MASTDVRDFYLIWTQDSADARMLQKKLLDQSFERIAQYKSPVFARIKKSANRKSPVWEWGKGFGFANEVTGTIATTTLTFSGNLIGEAISSDNLQSHIRKNMILMREADGLLVKITSAVDYSAMTCTVAAYGNSGSLSDDSAATTYRIVGHASSDYDDTYVPQSLPRSILRCSSQIWKSFIELPHSRRDMAMEFVSDEFKDNYEHVVNTLHAQIATSCLVGKPYYSGGYKHALNVESPTMTGILGWAAIEQETSANTDIYVDMGGDAPNMDSLNLLVHNLVETEYADLNRGDWCICCHPVAHQYICDEFLSARQWNMKETELGYEVTSFKSKLGKVFKLIADPFVPRTKLFVADLNDFEWAFYGEQGIRCVKLAESTGNVDQHKVTCQVVGLKCGRPRHIGVLYDMPDSYTV